MSEKNSFDQIMDLIRQTGDRCVVVDDEKKPYVIMTLKEYEKLIFQKSQKQQEEGAVDDKRLTNKDYAAKINPELKQEEAVDWKFDENQKVYPDFISKNFMDLRDRNIKHEEERYYTEPLD